MEILLGPFGFSDWLEKLIVGIPMLIIIFLPLKKPNVWTYFLSAFGVLAWLFLGAVAQAIGA